MKRQPSLPPLHPDPVEPRDWIVVLQTRKAQGMMKPGCYGSAVFFSPFAPECVACPHLKECDAAVRSKDQAVLRRVCEFDTLLGTHRGGATHRWFSKRWMVRRTAPRPSSDFSVVTERWKKLSLNPFHLKHGTNPIAIGGGTDWELFNFILKAGPFKPRDLVEHMRDTDRTLDKATVERLVKETCGALVSLGILKKEGLLFSVD